MRVVPRQNGAVLAGVTMALTFPCESVVAATLAAPAGVTCGALQVPYPSSGRSSRSRAPALTQAVESPSLNWYLMVTAPDGQPFTAGTGPVGASEGEAVMRTGVTIGP